MKISHLESIGELPKYLQKKLSEFGTYSPLIKSQLSKEEALREVKDAEIIIAAPSAFKPIDEEFISQLKITKHIALVTVGCDWIDFVACKKRGITISRPLGANSEAAAEHTVGLMIDLAKRITEFDKKFRNGDYDFRNYQGVEFYNKTLGILGLGNVGSKVLRIAKAFNMKVLVFDRSEKSCEEYQVVDLKNLLTQSDFIAICLPLSNETKDLIGENEIKQIKTGAIVVNAAREKIVNKKSILEAINSGKINGYGVETAIMQTLEKDDPYFQYDNVIINPHNAFNTKETEKRVNEMVVANVISFIKGKPQNILV
jgi:phosphoglycerate dehydrogenase-like enzyme